MPLKHLLMNSRQCLQPLYFYPLPPLLLHSESLFLLPGTETCHFKQMLCNTKPDINYVDSTFKAVEERSSKSVWASKSSLQHVNVCSTTDMLCLWAILYRQKTSSLQSSSAKWKRVQFCVMVEVQHMHKGGEGSH